ncbi:hypothetical protein FE257_011580 [Aspergillus nanangensis]|uniref:DUF1754-domain-containing protein n=1 Tax=Aspergillus nanangensis TaxID=2582783 RepID=A0AAD4CH06_ASPNN|nr:hypothetical protein FE257_011580 [Aspergillus nanangensis]
MPGDDYSTGGGGKLKLKGPKVSDGRVEKKKKKKSKKSKESELQQATPGESSAISTPALESKSPADQSEDHEDSPAGDVAGKTETEIKHEEARRKRMQERLKRDGVKTHKERVEELNKYLSRLSEHHDMAVNDA